MSDFEEFKKDPNVQTIASGIWLLNLFAQISGEIEAIIEVLYERQMKGDENAETSNE